MILLIDNFDSFVHNLARYFRRLGQETLVVRNDAINVAQLRELSPAAVVISPGPGGPENAGCSIDVVRQMSGDVPILGVCLGHQVVVRAMGGRVRRSGSPMHGRTSTVAHDGRGLFAGLPVPLTVCRYHSLAAEPDSLPSELFATASSADGEIMAVEHRRWPVFGVQFHPEAVLTEAGYQLLANFLQAANCSVSVDATSLAESEYPSSTASAASAIPVGPVTF